MLFSYVVFSNVIGEYFVRETIRLIEDGATLEESKKKIFEDNPSRLFHLSADVNSLTEPPGFQER